LNRNQTHELCDAAAALYPTEQKNKTKQKTKIKTLRQNGKKRRKVLNT